MKLAELLMERAECQRRIAQLSSRLRICAKVQEGDTPPVKPEVMLKEVVEMHTHLEDIIRRINNANVTNELQPGLTIADAVTRRDMLRSQRELYDSLAKEAQSSESRYSMKEIRFVATMDVAELIKKTDEFAKAVRMLDTRIQAKNWEIEVEYA